jgi:hypothetical protein
MSNLRTDHEIEIDNIHDRQLAEKDAEIQRLKAELDLKENSVRDLCTIVRSKNKLITELADALENVWKTGSGNTGTPVLIHRAREAVR